MDVTPMPALAQREAFGPPVVVKPRLVSPDGRWRWTGSAWVPMSSSPSTSTLRTAGWGALWLASLTLWMPIGLVAMRDEASGWDLPGVLFVAALLLPLPSTLAWGVHLGRAARWAIAAMSVPAGGAALGGAYVFAFVLGPDANADQEAGAGVVLLGVPALLGLGVLVAAGAGIGVAWRRARARHSR